MPPRGNEGLDFTPILTHYLFLFTSILAVVSVPSYLGIERKISHRIHGSSDTGWLVCSLHITSSRDCTM